MASPSERRRLRFTTIDEALAEADRLAAADRGGQLQRAGKWSLGQTLGHLATWANFAFEGYPPEVRMPLPLRLVVRLFRNRFLNDEMPAGVKIPRVPGGTVGVEPLDIDEGLRRFRLAFSRLQSTEPTRPNPIFGLLTHEQWMQLNLRHAELHLGIQLPQSNASASGFDSV